MKITELKLGDLVSCHGEILKVAVCDMFMCSAWNENEDLRDDINYDELSPIPLTEEVLEKNGWDKDDVQWILFHLVIQYDKVDDDFTIYVHQNGECNYLTEIEYVHELQHILWALGIDDDLKI